MKTIVKISNKTPFEVYEIAENRLLVKTKTKNRPNWPKSLLNRPRSVKTDLLSNTGTCSIGKKNKPVST